MLVLVDLDDTLCNTWEAGKRTLVRFLFFLFRKRKFRAILYFLAGRYKRFERAKHVHVLDLDSIVEVVMRDIYPNISEEELREITSNVEETFFKFLKLYPDAIPFLSGVRKLGATVVLITDSSTEWQRKKIRVLGIEDYFDDVIISGETGHSKLDDYNFQLALRRFPSDEIYAVGDRDDTDMRGGKSIGAITILVRRGYFKSRKVEFADYVVKDLFEALEVIRSEHKKRAET
ncbi:HAD family hydrolase [Thermococcus sp.]